MNTGQTAHIGRANPGTVGRPSLSDIVGRLLRADGPSFMLDSAIFETMLPTEWAGSTVLSWFGHGTGKYGCNTFDGCRHLNCLRAPAFTASLDAALTLVPEGLFWHVACGKTRPDEPLSAAHIVAPNTEDVIAAAEAATPVLALCIAALNARIAKAEGRS